MYVLCMYACMHVRVCEYICMYKVSRGIMFVKEVLKIRFKTLSQNCEKRRLAS